MTITLRIRFAWWLEPYIALLQFFCLLVDGEPDWAKLERVICRAMRIEAA